MSQTVSVYLLPKLFEPDQLRGGCAVVIDVLRASTTIIHALAAGAKAVIPCEEIDEAKQLAANHSPDERLLGGERDGVRIEGFDLDNSPLAYTAEAVAGKTIIFTSTNGTRALARANLAEPILIGSFVNIRATIDQLINEQRPVHLVCAGTCGEITSEDVLFAGAVATALKEENFQPGNDEADIAGGFFQRHTGSSESLFDALCKSTGGNNLLQAGFDADIRRAADMNRFDIVPQYNSHENTITISV
ncbi:MAG: 2-phosphosulfolactate phosphatase [Planctomycetaceae bacterium]|jgi:2-phosphosulfolactate phosphatase|nr:2-phosphosulfolactate phosphatase [Planctomycetaceae bacterium]MBT6154762.1 2-phosphosulfolactate phosphatase [Planctomycetaceae bacterium]MBT6485334.1 2-phosphosulfolactate phosphatase [Planctomycetaceae bacterium]MBT6496639.1 2-phosphosulfolactate phosphatase [Planctomycetaceae bacterium]